MKDYFLDPLPGSCEIPSAFNARLRSTRDTDVLIGICKGIIADGAVNSAELMSLKAWFTAHKDVEADELGRSIHERIKRICSDGIITDEERSDFALFISAMVGGGPLENKPTSICFDVPPPGVSFENRHFCFTGQFLSGSRAWCQKEVVKRYGIADANLIISTNYLVIGSLVSPDWAHTSYGRKIEKALTWKGTRDISIVSESHWLKHLDETPADGDEVDPPHD